MKSFSCHNLGLFIGKIIVVDSKCYYFSGINGSMRSYESLIKLIMYPNNTLEYTLIDEHDNESKQLLIDSFQEIILRSS